MSKKCQNCGAEMADDMNFCPTCHAKNVPVTPVAPSVPNQQNAPASAASSRNAEQVLPAGGKPLSNKLKIIVLIVSLVAIFINLIILLISEFVFPQFLFQLCIAGIVIAVFPSVFFSVFMKPSLSTKVLLYIGCALALIPNGITFCWQSETVCKYSLALTLEHYRFIKMDKDDTINWRNITVEGDTYKISSGSINPVPPEFNETLAFRRRESEVGVTWEAADKTTQKWLKAAGRAQKVFQNKEADDSEFEKPDLD